ncbi:MAG: murein DD-endopeptidase MepM/ murein hydrolase activator NlpD [Cognaticolwellia sp.]|jgi:murein DD-endopeptidase MepM/ murein hydrolase activator NlpD
MQPEPEFHPVVLLPPWAKLLDLSGPNPEIPPSAWSIGKYDELRPGVYTTALFGGSRHLHVGVDLGGPVGTAVHAFADGRILHQGYNPAAGDYGHVIVTEHSLGGRELFALHGHLSQSSIGLRQPGETFSQGQVIAWLGAEHENGGWPPHVHFQLSWERPETHDMPGAVDPADRAQALKRYPDPRRVLGPLW